MTAKEPAVQEPAAKEAVTPSLEDAADTLDAKDGAEAAEQVAVEKAEVTSP